MVSTYRAHGWAVCTEIQFLLAGTMFELVQALNDDAEVLKKQIPNSISLNAGCELFIAFVTLFPHESDVRHPFALPWG